MGWYKRVGKETSPNSTDFLGSDPSHVINGLSRKMDSGKIIDYSGYGHKVLLWYDRCNVGLICIYIIHDIILYIYTYTCTYIYIYICNWYIKCFHVFPIYAWLVFGPNTGSICIDLPWESTLDGISFPRPYASLKPTMTPWKSSH